MNYLCKPGAGLRPAHYFFYEQNLSHSITWFEAVTENFFESPGRPRETLNKIRSDFPVALHGVSLNIASSDELDLDYLTSLKKIVDEIDPFLVSDHLCWTGLKHSNIHDLLPLPYTNEMLKLVVERVDQVQNFIGKPILLENASSYFSFKNSEMTEWEFFNQLMQKSGCNMLLDINNVYVSASNNGFNPYDYLDKINKDKVKQIHLAGYTDMGTYLFDTHSKPVYPAVWNMFASYIKKSPEVPFMIEWDDEIPEFPVFEQEIKKAISIWNQQNYSEVMPAPPAEHFHTEATL